MTHLRGENGSGKSTFLELVSGYLRPWTGRVLVAGHPAAESAARRNRRVSRTQPSLYHDMTARDHLVFGARYHAASVPEQMRRADAYGLGPWLDTAAGRLSTGNARKLWWLLTTVGESSVVVADEPFNGLDAQGLGVLVEEIDRWRAERLIVLVAHQMPVTVTADSVVSLSGAAAGDAA